MSKRILLLVMFPMRGIWSAFPNNPCCLKGSAEMSTHTIALLRGGKAPVVEFCGTRWSSFRLRRMLFPLRLMDHTTKDNAP